MSAGDQGPCFRSHSISWSRVWALVKIQSENWLNAVMSRVSETAKRRTVTPRIRSAPSGYSFFQVT